MVIGHWSINSFGLLLTKMGPRIQPRLIRSVPIVMLSTAVPNIAIKGEDRVDRVQFKISVLEAEIEYPVLLSRLTSMTCDIAAAIRESDVREKQHQHRESDQGGKSKKENRVKQSNQGKGEASMERQPGQSNQEERRSKMDEQSDQPNQGDKESKHNQIPGFTLSEGSWWYRIISTDQVEAENPSNNTTNNSSVTHFSRIIDTVLSQSLTDTTIDPTLGYWKDWRILDCPMSFDLLMADLSLGIKWSNIETHPAVLFIHVSPRQIPPLSNNKPNETNFAELIQTKRPITNPNISPITPDPSHDMFHSRISTFSISRNIIRSRSSPRSSNTTTTISPCCSQPLNPAFHSHRCRPPRRHLWYRSNCSLYPFHLQSIHPCPCCRC